MSPLKQNTVVFVASQSFVALKKEAASAVRQEANERGDRDSLASGSRK